MRVAVFIKYDRQTRSALCYALATRPQIVPPPPGRADPCVRSVVAVLVDEYTWHCVKISYGRGPRIPHTQTTRAGQPPRGRSHTQRAPTLGGGGGDIRDVE